MQTTVWGTFYSFPLNFNNIPRYVEPLPWQAEFPTVFKLVNFEGPVLWTQYLPFYKKQIDGYTFTYPGGFAGQDFKLFVRTECGLILIYTSVDDPTPTPPAQNTDLPTPAPLVTPPLR